MKIRLIAIVLALAAFSWAQTTPAAKPSATQTSTASVPAATEASCPCCQKMADSKAAESCCAHNEEGSSAKSQMPCCKAKQGKDGVSCMKGDKDKSAAACGSNGKCGDGKEGCCAKADKSTEQAIACCRASGEHCGMAHHEHADINK